MPRSVRVHATPQQPDSRGSRVETCKCYYSECVRKTPDVQSFEEACPDETYGPIFEKGTEGTVWGTCTTDTGDEVIDFMADGFDDDRGWVRETCCGDDGQNRVKVYRSCIDETWTVSRDDIDGGQICYC